MNHYSFRALTPDGKIVFETTEPAKNIGEAIAIGLLPARSKAVSHSVSEAVAGSSTSWTRPAAGS